MSSSEDEMPPPLEDMSEKIATIQEKKKKQEFFGGANTEEEIRLKPKAKPDSEQKSQGGIPMREVSENASKNQTQPQTTAVATKQPQKKQTKSSGGFGGFSAGFLNAQPKKKPAAQKKPVVEDYTHVKAKPKDENLRFDEVQDAMKTNLEKSKDQWLTPDLLKKLAGNPKLLKAFQNPQYMAAFQELGSDPKKAMEKYGNNPEFRELLTEFSALMGTHFEDVAETQKKKADEEMKNDPVMQTINTDDQVKEILADPEVHALLNQLRVGTSPNGLDFNDVMRKNPRLGQKLMVLIQKGVLNTHSAPPV